MKKKNRDKKREKMIEKLSGKSKVSWLVPTIV